MAKKNEYNIADAINAFLESNGIKEKALVQRVISDWEKIMGKALSDNTEELWFDRGIFYVRMSHPTWKNELQLAKTKLKDLLNKELGGELVKEVRIV